MKEIDARGLACPAPVLMTKAAIENEKADVLKIIVDSKASKENVSLFLESRQFDISVEEKEGNFHITGKGRGISPAGNSKKKPEPERKDSDCDSH
ncbi:MAG: sulfurtransferase TusA family protein [Desulfobacterales bacterium]